MEELKRKRIEYYEDRAKRLDNQYILDRIHTVKKDDWGVGDAGEIMNIEEYNRNITEYYNYNNPFLTQGQQVVISTKALRK